ncbi:MAG: hypothetical protein IJ055_07680 [Oscillospiraceae bacterium]|nr:hypothetical protein [Oscillospiraceae bacterium]
MEELQEKLQGLLSDPESMQQLSELAGMLTQEAPPETPGSAPELPDMGALMKMGQLLQTKETPDANAALLLALRPHLGVRRQARVDKAVRLLRLWRIWQTLQESGMLGELL